jgi:hypothetical protein
MKKIIHLIATAFVILAATAGAQNPSPVKISEFSISSPVRKSIGYYGMRWCAAVSNTGTKPVSGNVWLGGVDSGGFTDSQLCAHRIENLQPGQTIRFTEEATITDANAANFKKWTVSWYQSK